MKFVEEFKEKPYIIFYSIFLMLIIGAYILDIDQSTAISTVVLAFSFLISGYFLRKKSVNKQLPQKEQMIVAVVQLFIAVLIIGFFLWLNF